MISGVGLATARPCACVPILSICRKPLDRVASVGFALHQGCTERDGWNSALPPGRSTIFKLPRE